LYICFIEHFHVLVYSTSCLRRNTQKVHASFHFSPCYLYNTLPAIWYILAIPPRTRKLRTSSHFPACFCYTPICYVRNVATQNFKPKQRSCCLKF
jgi:hypothetical protein